MSTIEICPSCRTPAAGEEFCPECFAPRVAQAPIFTRSETMPVTVANRAPGKPGQPPPLDLRQVQYRAPSWFTRFQMKSRATVASLIVGSFFLVSAAYFWTRHVRDEVNKQYDVARVAVAKGDYPTAIGCYQISLEMHEQIFDRDGQVQDLIAQSRCLSAQGLDDEALVRLQRAALIRPSEEVTLATTRIHRLKGLEMLNSARAQLEASKFEKAQEQALKALDSLTKGESSPAQRAGAHRVAALALARLGKDEEARAELAQARKTEGDSSANKALAAKLGKLAAQHRKDRELAIKQQKARELALAARVRERNRQAAKVAAARQAEAARQAQAAAAAQTRVSVPTYSYDSLPSARYASHQLPSAGYPTYHAPDERSSHYAGGQPASLGYPSSSEPSTPTRVSSRLPQTPGVKIPSIPGFRF